MGTIKVSLDQIRAALKLCKGNVSDVSKVLGVARNNLYKRMAANGIDPEEFRGNSQAAPGVTQVVTQAAETRGGRVRKRAQVVHLSSVASNAIYPSAAPGRSLADMSSVAAVPDEPKALRVSRTVYFRPDHARLLDDACLDLPAVLRERVSLSKIIEMVIDERGIDWLKEKLAAHARAESGDR